MWPPSLQIFCGTAISGTGLQGYRPLISIVTSDDYIFCVTCLWYLQGELSVFDGAGLWCLYIYKYIYYSNVERAIFSCMVSIACSHTHFSHTSISIAIYCFQQCRSCCISNTEVSICKFYTRVLRTFAVLTGLRTYEAILTDLQNFI